MLLRSSPTTPTLAVGFCYALTKLPAHRCLATIASGARRLCRFAMGGQSTRRSRAWHRARPRLLERLCLRCGDWARDSHFGFDTLGLHTIVGSTFSSNSAVARLAEWFGAEIVATRRGPEWMSLARWRNVDWRSTRQQWQRQTSKTHRISGASS